MNKLWIKPICAFVGGGVVGYFLGKKITEKTWTDEINKASEEMKRGYEDAVKAYREEETKNEKEWVDDTMIDYTSVVPNAKPDLEFLAAKYEEEHPEDDEPDEPYIMKPEEFDTDPAPHFILQYYINDDTLVDDQDRILSEVDILVGDCLDHFDDHKDLIFVKNPRTDICYEISKIEGSYEEIVLGIQPTEENSKIRRRRMRDE